MGYEAGNLELSILGFSEKAVTSIDVTAKALRRLASAIDKVNNTQFVFAGQKIEVLFTKIAKASNSINTANLQNLADAAKSLSSISRIAALDKMDFDKVGKGFSTLSTAIEPFLNKVKQAESSLVSLDNILRKSGGNKLQKLLGDNNAKNNGGFLGLAKLGISIYSMRRLGRFAGDLVQSASDYNETLNLWQVAMRENLDIADKFVNKMQKAYGISSKTLMEAQAVFKNMIGSLGQISDETAYALSEALVQMSADYASLYNRTLKSAFENMQSMLAGQVRPIRSAGLDMTETTLYQYYQQLGGTKSMRQLNRTEKQLLSILAVYRQMGSAGALGDMSKTLNQFANQSRMMVEYWRELKTWSGMLLKDLIDQSGALIYINALLITTTEIVKAIAKSRGLGEDNFIDGMFVAAEATNEEVDELQGKLLDFDKFRSLQGQDESPLAIDEKLLEAITGYSSKIDQAQNAAQKLAETWLKFWLTDEGTLTPQAEDLLDTLKEIGTVIAILLGYKIGAKIVGWVSSLFNLTNAAKSLNTILITGAIYAIIKAVEAFKEGDIATGIIATTIGVTLVGALVAFKLAQYNSAKATEVATLASQKQSLELTKQGYQLKQTASRLKTVAISLGALVASYGIASGVIDQFSGNGKKIASWAFIVVGAITAVTAAILAMNSVISWGTALPILLAGVGAAIAGVKGLMPTVDMYAEGASDIDGGTLFVAGEMGKTEAVYTGSNGKTNVANIQQMKAAHSQALNEWWRVAKNDIPAFQGVSDSGLYTIVGEEAKKRGKTFAKV